MTVGSPGAALDDLREPLAAWLTEHGIGSGPVVVTDLERPAAGQSNDTVVLTATWPTGSRRLVLRRQAADNQIFRDADVLREARVLRGLRESRVPVPGVWGTEGDPAWLGTPFFVMDHVPGRVPLGKPSIHSVGWLPTLSTAGRETLWASALETLVAVHEVDWRPHHSFLLDGREAAHAASGYLDWLLGWYRWTAAGREFPITDAAVETLASARTRLERAHPVLVWGDARVGNMIFGADHRVTAAIDWEVAAIGAAERDVAHWLFFDEFSTDRRAGWPGSTAGPITTPPSRATRPVPAAASGTCTSSN